MIMEQTNFLKNALDQFVLGTILHIALLIID